jgi:adenylate cyclase 3
VEFALELKKALQGINEQSFNHFVLKMGEHTPISTPELHFLHHIS